MKTKISLFFIFMISIFLATAQCPDLPVTGIVSGNAVEAMISNGGDLFNDGGYNGFFHVPVEIEPHRSTIFAAGL